MLWRKHSDKFCDIATLELYEQQEQDGHEFAGQIQTARDPTEEEKSHFSTNKSKYI